MLDSPRHLIKRALVFTILCASCARVSVGDTRPDDYIGRAMQLFRSLYPGLQRSYPRGLRAVIWDETDLFNRAPAFPDEVNPFTMSFYERSRPVEPPSPQHREFLVSAYIYFLSTGQLRALMVSGPFVRERAEMFEKEVNNHAEWSDGRVVKELKMAGAKFGPDDRAEFLRTLPLKALEPCTGRLEVVSADIRVRIGVDGDKREAGLTWVVRAKAYSLDGGYETDCTLMFEPFDGKLINYSITSAPKPIKR
jgi:hypothetical protein